MQTRSNVKDQTDKKEQRKKDNIDKCSSHFGTIYYTYEYS